ncbi:MAG: RelA/SpoT family protein, partial [Bacteroidota bacterium]
FAVRIILDSPPETEKADCWRAYSIVTDFFVPNPDRLRDWISTPKANGYESLHTTVMSASGKWVEVQIRSERMDEIAEKGYAAHWKYKDTDAENALDEWLSKIRELLEHPESSAIDFIDDFKLNLFSDEIFIFTPKGELKTMPAGSTALDFAFDIHTDVGSRCIGAKINHKLVPISHKLNSGDQVEILTSTKQHPKEDWLSMVVTAKAKSKIKTVLREQKKLLADEGKAKLDRKLRNLKVEMSSFTINDLLLYYKVPNQTEFYYRIAIDTIDISNLGDFFGEDGKPLPRQITKSETPSFEEMVRNVRGNVDSLVIGEDLGKIDYKLATCCNPISGDDVFGFITVDEGIKIHRTNCPNAMNLMSKHGYRIVKAKWTEKQDIAFLAGIMINGVDEVGVVNNITKVISNELKVNMRSISIDSNEGLFQGTIMLFVRDTEHLIKLMGKLRQVNGILSVSRID